MNQRVYNERLLRALALIRKTPEHVVALHTYHDTRPVQYGCQTIACGAGWCAISGEFDDVGFEIEDKQKPDGMVSVYDPVEKVDLVGMEAVEYVFGSQSYIRYFAMREDGIWDKELLFTLGDGITDKELLIARLEKGLKEYGFPTAV